MYVWMDGWMDGCIYVYEYVTNALNALCTS